MEYLHRERVHDEEYPEGTMDWGGGYAYAKVLVIARRTKSSKPKSFAAGHSIADTAELDASFHIVGIGASAGGLAAFRAFFSGMPTDPNMAFVLVQHLAPDHASILTDLIGRCTGLPVFEVEDSMVVRCNCIYIIPPDRDMALLNGALQLLKPNEQLGHRLPIDFFFRSLAQDQHARAVGIVLSGTGSDGTAGVRAIKGEFGMVMAQNPDSCEFDGMPRSAIATGLVDYILPPAEMPVQLISYFGRGKRTDLATINAENALKKIFVLLRAQTGHDFSEYKPTSIIRLLERRMAIHQIRAMDGYIDYLQQTPAEVETFFLNLLIGVTNFFREPPAFQALEEQVIPKLFAGDPAGGDAIRVWSAGCSSGEEAYSIAILLQERMEALQRDYPIQLFATDIDPRRIATARAGVYPASIANDVSPQRLARFFVAEPDGSAYKVKEVIRDMVVFSTQDVIKDPPFSKLGLLSCRNLLIYFGAELQRKLIPLFHYALNPGGTLFLGTSEGVGDHDELFTPLDRKAKLFKCKAAIHPVQHSARFQFMPPRVGLDAGLARVPGKIPFPVKLPLRELTEQALLEQIAPVGALVNGQGDILYLHGRTGRYLEPAPGETGVNNILKMARKGLRRDLEIALRTAVGTQAIASVPGLRVKTNGDFTLVNLTIRPVATAATTPESPLYLVILEESPAGGAAQPGAQPSPDAAHHDVESHAEARIAALEERLRARDEYVQSTQEELEKFNEELKSSNEEMQSVNEELQSTNEELQTSKEELQSVNEELATVNTELQTKVSDLTRVNNDMSNLLAGTGIATIFVDRELRILRFTPAAGEIINLILSDVGRPVGHIASNLVNYDDLVADATAVLDTLIPREVKMQSTAGRWYVMRIRPYRTLDNVIEGAVITFVDITEMKRIEDDLAKTKDLMRLAVVVHDAFDAITVQDLNGRVIAWNPAAQRMYGWSETEALLMNVRDRIPTGLLAVESLKLSKLSPTEPLVPYSTQRLTKTGGVVDVWITATAMVNQTGQTYAIATTERARQSG